ncbi:MAG: plasmid pRiA4b ORF-3 family protein [Ignavibacteriales bacterium]|nr:plasmid pRiA4b ORF-3 family protein [Ignavibacteriales bacterium]MCF8438523.1 plasmid pRiA4b ORF-3 family protein [Ignavibacteriales bacterium]
MSKKITEVYQFKITLTGSKPSIWRRILVPSNYSFWDLHVAIQDSMGWLDCHLHSFSIKDPITKIEVEIGIPNEEYDAFGRNILADHKIKISKYFNESNLSARYEYDFGDSWIHTVKFEKILQAAVDEKYPKCIAGQLACPPEDCGGIGGYYNLLSVLSGPKNEEYNEMIEWLGGEFNPEIFDPKSVSFDNPKERFKLMN